MDHFNNTTLIKNIEFFNQLDNILTCTFCHGFLVNPRECNVCQNSFCNDCIKSWDDSKKNYYSCPMRCEKNIFVKPHKNTLQMLEKLIIKCFRCSKYVNYNQLEDHVENKCEKLKIECSHPGCTEKIMKDSLNDHLQICEYGLTDCEECGQSTPRKNLKKIIDSIRKMITDKNIENDRYSREIDNLKESNEIYIKEIENLNKTKENLQKENENMNIANESLQNDVEKLNKQKSSVVIRNVTYKFIDQMLQRIDNDIQSKRIGSIFSVMDGTLKVSGVFLKANEIKILFKKLLNYHKEDNFSEYFDSIEVLMGRIFETHQELFITENNLTVNVIDQLFYVYSLENNSCDKVVIKGLKVLIRILKFLRQYVNDKYFNNILKILLRLLKRYDPEIIKFSCKILEKFADYSGNDFKLYIEDLLNALKTAINYSSYRLDKEKWKDARDNAIAVMGKIIYYQYNKINGRVWMNTWLSFFTFDLDFYQTNSYKSLCQFLECLEMGKHDSKVLLGHNMENLPKIIKLLANFYNTEYSKKKLNDKIESYFKKIKENTRLLEYVRRAKTTCDAAMYLKLSTHFP
jgi:FtsZ-binding cell division protein ZapB